MIKSKLRINLQMFADGEAAPASGAEGNAATGGNVTATGDTGDAGQRLRELGVPEDVIKRRLAREAKRNPVTAGQKAPAPVAPQQPSTPAVEQPQTTSQTTYNWEEVMKDPACNQHVQDIVKTRLGEAKTAQDNMTLLNPALELMAERYGVEAGDYAALADAINNDEDYWEDVAMEYGTSVERAKELRGLERQHAEEQKAVKEQKMHEHFEGLQSQIAEMKQKYPGFDFDQEMQNEAFVKMTSPEINIPIEDAYYALHRSEIQSASMKYAVDRTAEQISDAIQAGQRRPTELGMSSTSVAAAPTKTMYHDMTKEQREAIKNRVYAGENVVL